MNEAIERRDLEMLALAIAIPVQQAIQAAIVTNAAQLLFHRSPASFSTNPANTFVFAAVDALEELSVCAARAPS